MNNYTAAYTVNETGYGVLSTNGRQVQYSHYSTAQGWMDSFVINVIASSKESKNEVQEIHNSKDGVKNNLIVAEE